MPRDSGMWSRPVVFALAFFVSLAALTVGLAIPLMGIGLFAGMVLMPRFVCLLCVVPALVIAAIAQRFICDDDAPKKKKVRECRLCGYSLRGNTSRRCPECGTMCDISRGGQR